MKTTAYITALAATVIVSAALVSAGEKTQTFPAKKGGTLEVRVEGGSVTVKGWEKDEVTVRAQCIDEEQLEGVTFSEGGGKVLVEFRARQHNVEDMHFEASVPSSFNVQIWTAGGELDLPGPLTGTLRGETAGGEVTLGKLGGKIRFSTAGGSIKAADISGDLEVRTAGGDIDVKSVTGTAELSTAGGRIKVDNAARTLKAETAGGEIEIGKVGGDLKASTAGGSISVGSIQGETSLNTAGGAIAIAQGTGRLAATTSAGDIRLKEFSGAANLRTAAGDIAVTLDPAVGESSSMSTSAGSIRLTVPATAKASILARARGWGDEEAAQISSDFPMTRPEKDRAEITLNGGGHRIMLETTVGSIAVLKGK